MNYGKYYEEVKELLLALCRIPAPSLSEDARAAFCRDWFLEAGFRDVKVDGAKNVICALNDRGDNGLLVFMAHTDTVFPDTEPFEPQIRDGILSCPGCGDDTANLALMMVSAKILLNSGKIADRGILFVANAGEEGLGNLVGSRALAETYGDRILQVVSFDSSVRELYVRAVGSARYRIEVKTEGGHSYGDFGNRNAIHVLSQLVCDFYSQNLPDLPGTKTTCNVGQIRGGTSVNTIAESAEMLYEYRSDSNEGLNLMKGRMEEILEWYRREGIDLSCRLLGSRPGMGVCRDESAQEELILRAEELITEVTGSAPVRQSGSTDCNIPFSLGIPAVCFGLIRFHGAHTRGECLELDSLTEGLELCHRFMESCF